VIKKKKKKKEEKSRINVYQYISNEIIILSSSEFHLVNNLNITGGQANIFDSGNKKPHTFRFIKHCIVLFMV